MNLSQQKRERMLEFLNDLKQKNKSNIEVMKEINEIETELTSKKYGLVWEEHEEKVDLEMKTKIPVFTEVKDKQIKTCDKSYNFLLEGDNLHSLYLLEKTHKESIDLIYIDPPYNTGADDFKYDDNFINEEDGFRHSKWLSFMEKRLQIARNLLKDSGCIFIQINDIEVAQLKMMCDEIFNEQNFVNIISVNMKNIAGASGGGEDKKFKKNCEYILIYAKNYDRLPLFNGAYEYEEISELVERYKEEGISWKYTSVFLDSGDREYLTSTVDGDGNEIKIYKHTNYIFKSVGAVANEKNISEKEVYYKYAKKIVRTTMPQSSIRPRVMEKLKEIGYENDLISIEYIPKTGRNKNNIYTQFYKGDKYNLFAWLSDVLEEKDGKLYKKTLQGTYWDATAGTKNLTKEGNVEFKSGKKPIDLIIKILNLYKDKSITILDFFAGSGTTGHATISLNKIDEGSRKFILCTNNENDICEKITYQRIHNTIFGYTTGKNKKYDGINANLKYYKTDFIEKSNENLDAELNKHTKELFQLENAVDIDDKTVLLAFDNDDLTVQLEAIEDIKHVIKVYISRYVMLNSKQKKILKNIPVEVIPDYYFRKELKEKGLNWR